MSDGRLRAFGQSLCAGVFPIGVDPEAIAATAALAVKSRVSRRLKESLQGRASFLQIATATRSDVVEYRALRQRLGAPARDIAGCYAELDWSPIQYLNRSFSQRSRAGCLRLSQVALVTPLRDGMNLVAKEYVAAQDPADPGVLVLSLFAGAAYELDSAVIANPYDPDAVAEALHKAMQMLLEERRERWQAMMEVLCRNNITTWRESFFAF